MKTTLATDDLARMSLAQHQPAVRRNGVPLIKKNPTGRTITPEFVNELRDEYPRSSNGHGSSHKRG